MKAVLYVHRDIVYRNYLYGPIPVDFLLHGFPFKESFKGIHKPYFFDSFTLILDVAAHYPLRTFLSDEFLYGLDRPDDVCTLRLVHNKGDGRSTLQAGDNLLILEIILYNCQVPHLDERSIKGRAHNDIAYFLRFSELRKGDHILLTGEGLEGATGKANVPSLYCLNDLPERYLIPVNCSGTHLHFYLSSTVAVFIEPRYTGHVFELFLKLFRNFPQFPVGNITGNTDFDYGKNCGGNLRYHWRFGHLLGKICHSSNRFTDIGFDLLRILCIGIDDHVQNGQIFHGSRKYLVDAGHTLQLILEVVRHIQLNILRGSSGIDGGDDNLT